MLPPSTKIKQKMQKRETAKNSDVVGYFFPEKTLTHTRDKTKGQF
jgi:hypothetical protein